MVHRLQMSASWNRRKAREMKARPDLTPENTVVLSSPNDYYVDPQGLVNEIEDDSERLLFGTVAAPRPSPDVFVVDWAPCADEFKSDAERRLYEECERDVARACNPKTNPHLAAMTSVFGILGLTPGLNRNQRPKDASIPPIVEEEEDE